MAGLRIVGMEQRHVAPFLPTIIMARHFELHSGGLENGDAASGEVFFACFFTFLVFRAVGEGRTWALGKRVRRGRAQTVCVMSGCLIVMVVRGIRATCLLARYIGSALLQIMKFQHGNPKIRFFCNVNETDFDVFRGMAGGEQVLASYLQSWMVRGRCHVARSRKGHHK